ncbi:hypothetical protein ACJ41O_014337 [Fusarium nematophilum]
MSQQFKSINKLRDSRIIVFGGTSGIGLAVAAAALEHGAWVLVTSSNKEKVDAAVAHLKSTYPDGDIHRRISGSTCDLGNPDTLEQNLISLFEAATAPAGPTGEKQLIDHIVFTAGQEPVLVPLAESTASSILGSAVVRFVGPLIIGKLAPRYMRISNRFSITVTGGSMTRRPEIHWSVLASYAAGTEGMRFGLAKDLAPIRVNAVAPGVVVTPLMQQVSDEDRARWADELLTGELSQPEDVAEAYIYSMKDGAATGVLIDNSAYPTCSYAMIGLPTSCGLRTEDSIPA